MSYLFYISIFIYSAVLMFLYEKSANKDMNMFYLFLTFLILFLPLALRYNVGADYFNYSNMIEEAYETHTYDVFEIGWVPLLFVMDSLQLPPHFFFVITAFISVILILKSIPKSNAAVGICLYLTLGYIEMFTVVRQCFAATIYAYCFSKYLKNGKMICLFLGTLLSGCFHTSLFLTLIVVPFAYFFNIKNIKWSNNKTIMLFIVLLFIFSAVNFSDLIIEIISFTPYAVYAHMGERLIGKTETGTGIGMLLRYTIIFGILFYPRTKKISYNNLYTQTDMVRYSVVFILFAFFLLSNQIKIFMRLPLIFNSILCVVFIYKKNKYGKLQKLCLVSASFLLYFMTVLKSTRDIYGSWQLIPYYTIFGIN